jgi:outer membrane protein with beta-barrel domain
MFKLLFASTIFILSSNPEALAQAKSAADRPRPRKAAPVPTTATPTYNYFPTSPPEKALPELPATKYYYLTGLYSSANAIKYKGSASLYGTPTAFSATESTTGALGIAGGYMVREASHFGYSGEISYELPRTSSGVEGTVGTQGVHGTYDGNPSNSVLTVAANGNYSLTEHFYLYGGVNYPFTRGDGQSLNGLFGYQVGGGYVFTRHISSEFSYRVLRLKGTIDSPGLNLQVDEAAFSGMILALQYLF